MKMKLRRSVLFSLLVTVVTPLVLYTDTLGVYFTPASSRNEFMEDVSTFTFTGEIRPLNVLPQESSATLKEPLGVVYSENSFNSSSNYSDAANTRLTRQLTEESAEDRTTNSSTLSSGDGDKPPSDENPIRQVIDIKREAEVETGAKQLNKPKLVGVKEEIRSQHSEGTSKTSSEKMELKRPKRSGKDISREQVKGRTEKQNERTVMTDARVRQLKDQLILGKVYLSLSATRNNPHFVRELRLRMKEVQRALGDATKDSDLPKNAYDKMKAMNQTLLKGKQIQDDCATVVKKLRAMLHLAEEQLRVHKKQTLFLTHNCQGNA